TQFSFSRLANTRYAHPFPTRRSSDLARREGEGPRRHDPQAQRHARRPSPRRRVPCSEPHGMPDLPPPLACGRDRGDPTSTKKSRSEEHTSELQSRENLVCRLLPEKKN